jgi:hypothetical protein
MRTSMKPPKRHVLASNLTCKRVSAKHVVKDGFAFLWEHAIFRHPPDNKKPLTDRSEILHIVDYVGKTTKPAKNGYNRLARGGSPCR